MPCSFAEEAACPDAVRRAFDVSVLLEQLRQLGRIGRDASGGRTRLALTDADRLGRDQVRAWMRELDLNVTVDGIGNLFGCLPGRADLPPLMFGSHIDTVARAGEYDGCYGVLAGLAVLRAFRAAGVTPPRPLVVAAFTNEEGARFQPDMMGSLVYVGGLPLADALSVIGVDGARLGDELARIGYAGGADARSGAGAGPFPAGYFELHVEQGPVLEHERLDIGVVEGVQGISWQEITVRGQASHAGATPTALRRDAGLAAARIMVALREMVKKTERTLATVGSLRLEPDLVNVVPGRAVFTVDLRDPDEACLAAAERGLEHILAEVAEESGVTVSARRLVRFSPVAFAPAMIDRVERQAGALGLSCRRMMSGAGHDAQMLARVCPVGMIFVPSRGGLSHCPEEDTEPAALENGARVLLECALDWLGAQQAQGVCC